jgi:hypothetical protein
MSSFKLFQTVFQVYNNLWCPIARTEAAHKMPTVPFCKQNDAFARKTDQSTEETQCSNRNPSGRSREGADCKAERHQFVGGELEVRNAAEKESLRFSDEFSLMAFLATSSHSQSTVIVSML